jgi:hypothetical protein
VDYFRCGESIEDFIKIFGGLERRFREWKEWGIELFSSEGVDDDYATFVTDDLEVAKKARFAFKTENGRSYVETLSGDQVPID